MDPPKKRSCGQNDATVLTRQAALATLRYVSLRRNFQQLVRIFPFIFARPNFGIFVDSIDKSISGFPESVDSLYVIDCELKII
jgi:hypothetical protein